MGMGACVREGSIMEEQASGAHCVGLKQTILFPFVTLGSLINFCDCFMAGGTSRQNHSEVGSSYIHFNFTPDADKTTPSLIGDVPRGVMLNQPPIFLGGQGGIVGPARLGYGNVVAAGSILRHDYIEDNKLIFDTINSKIVRDYIPTAYPNIGRIVENNIVYLANMTALEAWYSHVRKPFLEAQQFGLFLYEGVMEQLLLARKERLKRLKVVAEKALSPSIKKRKGKAAQGMREFYEKMAFLEDIFNGQPSDEPETVERSREAFLRDFEKIVGHYRANYLETIQSLPAKVSSKGVVWLGGMVDTLCNTVAMSVPSLSLFKKKG
jgi:UDP-N-acetylglucosamine/UDP-N-acetylgalactosamine diphosphorylase